MRTAYYSGWRPTLPTSLRMACLEIAALIEQMWLADFRARPAMQDVVVRLEACATFNGAETPEVEAATAAAFAEHADASTEATAMRSLQREFAEFKTARNAEVAELKAALAQANAQLEMETPERFQENVCLREENERVRKNEQQRANEQLELDRAYAEARPAGPGEEKADRPEDDSALPPPQLTSDVLPLLETIFPPLPTACCLYSGSRSAKPKHQTPTTKIPLGGNFTTSFWHVFC